MKRLFTAQIDRAPGDLLLHSFGSFLGSRPGFAGFGIAVTNHMEAHEVRRPGFGSSPGDDSNDLPLMNMALSLENLFSHADELVGIAKASA